MKDEKKKKLDLELIKEWNHKQNIHESIENTKPYSNKKVWWVCEKGHEWITTPNHRTRGSGCPYCTNKKATKENSLAEKNPNLASEWHPTLNEKTTPYDVLPASNKRVWWVCKKGHTWEAVIKNRHIKHSKCPWCYHKKVHKINSLLHTNPSLAKEWHPTKNSISSANIMPNSNKKAWWICNKGHEWESKVYSRNKGAGCPICRIKRDDKNE